MAIWIFYQDKFEYLYFEIDWKTQEKYSRTFPLAGKLYVKDDGPIHWRGHLENPYKF